MIKTISTRRSEAIFIRTENIERYLKEISVYEKLSYDKEREYLKAAKNGDKKAEEKLVKANLRFVIACAKEYQSTGVEFADLINEGNLGLIEAVYKYDLSRENRFITYAKCRICCHIIDFIRKTTTVVLLPYNQQDELSKINKVKEEVEKEQETEITYNQLLELRDDLKFGFDYIRPTLVGSQEPVYIDQVFEATDDGGTYCLSQTLPSDGLINIERELTIMDEKKAINSALKKLSNIQREVLVLCFGLSDGVVRTNEDIAISLNKSAERIRQIKEKGMKTLKKDRALLSLLPN